MMFTFIRYFLAFLLCKIALSDLDEWRLWKAKFDTNKSNLRLLIKSEQERYNAFKKNLKIIKDHNAKFYQNQTTYKLGLNQFADKSESELFDLFHTNLNANKINSNIKLTLKTKLKKTTQRNDVVNWATTGHLAPIPNQGAKCGSCYAFASVAAVESVYAIQNDLKNENVIKFSEQQVIDCSINKNNGCNGGFVYYALDYILKNGIQSNVSYPYKAKLAECKYSTNKVVTKISSIKSISADDIETMKAVLHKQPIIGHLAILGDFFFYKSGIYLGNSCAKNCGINTYNGRKFLTNHIILIVGYGIENDQEYWICRNSYGPFWGENGYFRIPLGKQVCCIENWMYYPVL